MKYKGIEVKKRPGFLAVFPWVSKFTAFVVTPNMGIFVSPPVYQFLQAKNPDPKNLALLEHERKHLERQRELGSFRVLIGYLFFPRFRLNEELLAIKEMMKVYKKNNLPFDFERKAKVLSSWLYLWMTSFENAKKELEKIWKEVY